MKCAHCGSEWTVGGESAQRMKNCPFCGKSLQGGTDPEKKPQSLEDTLRQIREQFGMDPFRNGKSLISLYSDLAPDRQKDRRLIGHFVACDGHAFLEQALTKPKPQQSTALVRLVKRMYEDWLIREDAARKIVGIWWVCVLDGDADCLKSIEQPVVAAASASSSSSASVTSASTSGGRQTGRVCRNGDFRVEGTVLKEYTGKDSAIRLPSGVVTVGRGAFIHCKELQSVEIPEGVETLDMQAFLGCSNLREAILPQSLKTVGYAAFRDCTGLRTLTLPRGLRHIDDYAFKNCAGLETISLPEELETLGYEAFQDCVVLKTITLPKNLKSVAGCAFWGCHGLQTITLPEGLQSVGEYAMANCKALQEIRIPGSVSKINGNMFLRCESLRRVWICSGVKTIGVDAFDKCGALKTVVIPDSITEIHPNAFKGCSGITVQASQSWKKAHPDLLRAIESPPQ